MQRRAEGGIVISCDFCGVDWDPYDQSCSRPMVEGHQVSIICLECLQRALGELGPADGPFDCCMCLQTRPEATEVWAHPAPRPGPGLNAGARICRPCIRQAAGRFHKDRDVRWTWEQGR